MAHESVHILGLHGRDRGVERVGLGHPDKVPRGLLRLLVLLHKHLARALDVVVLHVDELGHAHGLHRQVHQDCLRDESQVPLDACVHNVVYLRRAQEKREGW